MDEGELVLHLDESEDTDDKSPPPTEKQNSKSTGDAVGGAAQNGENSGNIKSLVRSDTPAENENDRNSSSKVNEQKAIDANQEDKTAANVNEANTHKKSSNGPTVTSSVESNEKEDIEASRGRPTNKERGKGERTSSRSMGSSSTSSDEDLYSDGSSQSSAEVYEVGILKNFNPKLSLFQVEAIVSDKVVKGKTFFRIRWQNFSAKDDTWEPEENLLPNPNLAKTIEEYWADKKRKQDDKKKKRTSTKHEVVVKQEVTSIYILFK